jgi:hypothetical protein
MVVIHWPFGPKVRALEFLYVIPLPMGWDYMGALMLTLG